MLLCSGSGIFHSSNPAAYAKAIVEATTHYNNPAKIAEVCTGLGAGMKGENDLNRPGLTSKSALMYVRVAEADEVRRNESARLLIALDGYVI